MAEVSNGPVRTLAGHRARLPEGTPCDDHPDRLAVARVQGETDSFGCEYNDLCQECVDEVKFWAENEKFGTCDWCKTEAEDLRDRRDFEEGLAGRVYKVCGACVRRENARLEEEESRENDFYYYGDD